ncbi:HAD family hydrolase [Floccifex sp.]|uniref:HAD family hydrolase n=1 Tax=Floccifex sp. TaxID=2815810 RepID=UPI003F10F76E
MKRFETIKLIAMDLDGTLVNSQDTISKRNIDILNRAKEQGYFVTFLTGRHFKGLEKVQCLIQANAPVVCANGAQIYSWDGKILYQENTFEIESMMHCVQFLMDNHIDFIVRSNETEIVNSGFHHFRKNKPIEELFDIHQLKEFKAIKIMPQFDDKKSYEKVIQYAYTNQDISIIVSGDTLIDIAPKGINKRKGLEIVCDILNLSRENVMMFGDYENDIEALKFAKIGVCMANGSENTKKVADYICLSNDEDGVGQFIEENLLE